MNQYLKDLVVLKDAAARLHAADGDPMWEIPGELVLAVTLNRTEHLGHAGSILTQSLGTTAAHQHTIMLSEPQLELPPTDATE